MECSEKPIFHNYTRQELAQIRITAPEEAVRSLVKKHWDTLAKPLDGMGSFETITAQIGAILGTEQIDLRKKGVLIFCADNGIVEEGVSQTGQEVTLAVAKSMARKGSSVCKMAQSIGAETIPVDIGINSEESIPGVLDRKVRPGTRNFLKEPTMTEEETVRAIVTGIELVQDCKEKGYGLLATGEMGIGNTTTSAAVTAALTGAEAAAVTGRGAGLSTAGLERKIAVIEAALALHKPDSNDSIDVLHKVGGLDIAGLCGLYLGAAAQRIPVVLDGVISCAAALLAVRLCPQSVHFMVAAHRSDEPASILLLDTLGKRPFLTAGMHLGEGTGAAAGVALLDLALAPYREMVSFADIGMEAYQPQK